MFEKLIIGPYVSYSALCLGKINRNFKTKTKTKKKKKKGNERI